MPKITRVKPDELKKQKNVSKYGPTPKIKRVRPQDIHGSPASIKETERLQKVLIEEFEQEKKDYKKKFGKEWKSGVKKIQGTR